MRRLPHLVIDGALAAASVLGSDRIVFALDRAARSPAASGPAGARRAAELATGALPQCQSRRSQRVPHRPGDRARECPGRWRALPDRRRRPIRSSAACEAADAGVERGDLRPAGARRALRSRLVPHAGHRRRPRNPARDRQRRRPTTPASSRSRAAPTWEPAVKASGGLTANRSGVCSSVATQAPGLGPDATELRLGRGGAAERGRQPRPRHRILAAGSRPALSPRSPVSPAGCSTRARDSAVPASTVSQRSPTRSRSSAPRATAPEPTTTSNAGAGSSSGAAPAGSRTARRASSPARYGPSARSSTTTPSTAPARPAAAAGLPTDSP